MLQETASFLRSRVRATDIVARLGGDEFALVLTNMAGDRLENGSPASSTITTTVCSEHDPPLHLCQLSIGVAQIDAHIYRSQPMPSTPPTARCTVSSSAGISATAALPSPETQTGLAAVTSLMDAVTT